MSPIKAELAKELPLIATGKVRELYEVDADTLLFVASDRISAYDVIMDNVSFLINLCNRQRHSLKLYGRMSLTKESSSHS